MRMFNLYVKIMKVLQKSQTPRKLYAVFFILFSCLSQFWKNDGLNDGYCYQIDSLQLADMQKVVTK